MNDSSDPHSHSMTDSEHPQSPVKMVNGQKSARRKRQNSFVETEHHTGSGGERQEQRMSHKESVGSLDSDNCASSPQSQVDQRSESGIKTSFNIIMI